MCAVGAATITKSLVSDSYCYGIRCTYIHISQVSLIIMLVVDERICTQRVLDLRHGDIIARCIRSLTYGPGGTPLGGPSVVRSKATRARTRSANIVAVLLLPFKPLQCKAYNLKSVHPFGPLGASGTAPKRTRLHHLETKCSRTRIRPHTTPKSLG